MEPVHTRNDNAAQASQLVSSCFKVHAETAQGALTPGLFLGASLKRA